MEKVHTGEGGKVYIANFNDADGNPAGGSVAGVGFSITWQDGPVDRDAGETPSGAFVEDVTLALIERMKFYQDSRFACEENKQALHYLTIAQEWMLERRRDRKERGVLGKHEV